MKLTLQMVVINILKWFRLRKIQLMESKLSGLMARKENYDKLFSRAESIPGYFLAEFNSLLAEIAIINHRLEILNSKNESTEK